MTTPNILNFTIYGERCSGTTFLEEAITSNFNLPVMWYYDWKHFFGSYDFDADKKESEINGLGAPADNTLFIGIVRNPVRWLHSFSKRKQQLPSGIQTLGNFFQREFYSVNDKDEVIAEDVHFITKERFKNIFELRKVKNDFLMNVMPTKVQNYILITYEDLLYKYDETLDAIKNLYHLKPLHPKYLQVTNHTIDQNVFTGEREVDFSPSVIQYIWDNLDKHQERVMGYECVSKTTSSGNSKPDAKPLQIQLQKQPQPQPQPIPQIRSLKKTLPAVSSQPMLPQQTPVYNKPPATGILQNTPIRQSNTQKPTIPAFGMGFGMRINKGRQL